VLNFSTTYLVYLSIMILFIKAFEAKHFSGTNLLIVIFSGRSGFAPFKDGAAPLSSVAGRQPRLGRAGGALLGETDHRGLCLRARGAIPGETDHRGLFRQRYGTASELCGQSAGD
jgi:hypothetical protein